MKKILLLAFTATVMLGACKKENDEPKEEANVTINGQSYTTVKIGTQTWTAVNYNGTGGEDHSSGDVSYGKLYTWEEAKGIQLPSGWRLPSKEDYEELLKVAGGEKTEFGYWGNWDVSKKLISTKGWSVEQGTNTLGFNAVPAGLVMKDTEQKFENKGESAVFWSTTKVSATNENRFVFYVYVDNSYKETTIESDYRYYKASIRFVKDN
ncbi:hypothetical protein Pedsa_0553 [Pseudopedobacter saltans DSM 12145]|uniref:Fibrobacter succinogenes major paralogous domain-containing protein n=1 Tax=Pseudopedobacter saltans (strain ATCC 51119 / DSM 12145 / JCM 21818 / CCUG 39354 / LMG 10337 / NBRC 100064 / NCIMB 13643) TaxID=762903 RepID=F0S7A7_PSESL|nr:FISUMP domain-containing protein [Pseudopedobacter saltans]ADY51132.1 hypothetical protein Pedsa_0553 [Pseudopedobacter saltans DSM 12145]